VADPSTRNVAFALGCLRHEPALPFLISAASSEGPVRLEAVSALAKFEPREEIETALVGALVAAADVNERQSSPSTWQRLRPSVRRNVGALFFDPRAPSIEAETQGNRARDRCSAPP